MPRPGLADGGFPLTLGARPGLLALAWIAGTQPAGGAEGAVTLHVGVHREAGTLADIAVDGADGQCARLGTSRLVCPASRAVTVRWGPGGDWTLTGDTVVEPGQTGSILVLASDSARQDALDRLAGTVGPADVRALYLETSANPLPPLSAGMIAALAALASHDDWRVRREVARALVPYVRHTSSDPFPADAPSALPEGLLTKLARDPDKRVRQRTAVLIREIGPEDPRAEEASRAVAGLLRDPAPGVRRTAIVGTTVAAREGVSDALDAWRSALARVPEPGPVGRAACNGLARLRDVLEPESVDADGAVSLVLQHHPERAWRVWGAWRDAVPFDAQRASALLHGTAGLSESLVRHWAEREPDALAAVIASWEPAPPHSERHRVLAAWVGPRTDHAGLRAALGLTGDNLSDPDPAPPEDGG